MSSQVYLDFGSGFQNISAFVKYDTLVVDPKAFSENFHFAQNSASFDIIYDSDLFIAIRAADTIICKIESGLGAPMFYGKISPSKSRSYDGIVNNEIWSLQAEDQLQELDQPVGDICYSGYAVMNPADTDHSIVHQLAYRAGFTAGQVGSVTISTVIDKFVPNDEDDSILDILDTLLFEYQYALNMDATGKITPLQWSKTSPVTHTFNEDNIMLNVDIVDSDTTYYGAKVTWYEVEQATTTSGNQYLPLYNDSNFSYVQGTGWTPYPLLAGFSYPPETNVIDPTTGLPTVVNQQYDESAVSYLTNYAVVNKIDYNYKAFQSDFSSIVSTSDWQVEYSADPGITVASTFGNKQAAVVFDNPTASTQNLYYFRILGKVWYKSAERMMEVKNTAVSGRKLDEYVSNWIFDSTTAGGLVTNLARQYAAGSITYTFTSEEVIALGSCGTIVMNNGTNQECMVTEGPWDEGRRQYTYTLRAYSPNTGVISKQHYKVASSSVAIALAQDAQATADSALPMSSIGLVSMHRMDEMPEIPDGLSGTIIKQNPIPSLSGYITDGSISLVDGKIVIDPAGFSDLFRTSESCPINSWFIVEVESSAPSLLAFYNNGIAQNTISPSVVIPGEKKIYCYLIPSALSIGNRYGLWTTGGYGATVSKWYLGDFSYSSFPLDGTGLGLNATSAIGVLPVQAKYGKAIQGSLTASVQAPCSYGAVWTECFRFKLSVLGKNGDVSLLYGASDDLDYPLVNSILLQRQTYVSSDGDFLKIYVSDQAGNYVESWYDDDGSAYAATHYLFDGVERCLRLEYDRLGAGFISLFVDGASTALWSIDVAGTLKSDPNPAQSYFFTGLPGYAGLEAGYLYDHLSWSRKLTQAEWAGYANGNMPATVYRRIDQLTEPTNPTNIVAQLAPAYLGAVLDGYPTPNAPDDSCLRYSATSGTTNRGIFVWGGVDAGWVRTEDSYYIERGKTLMDIFSIAELGTYGVVADYTSSSTIAADYARFKVAIVDSLKTANIESIGNTGTGSFIPSGDRGKPRAELDLNHSLITLRDDTTVSGVFRKMQMGASQGLKAYQYDSAGGSEMAVHDLPDANIVSGFRPLGHLYWFPRSSQIGGLGAGGINTETNYSSDQTVNFNLSTFLPTGITNVKAIKAGVAVQHDVASVKMQSITEITLDLKGCNIYNSGTDSTTIALSRIAWRNNNMQLLDAQYNESTIPVNYYLGVPYITLRLIYSIVNMQNNDDMYAVLCTVLMRGFYV